MIVLTCKNKNTDKCPLIQGKIPRKKPNCIVKTGEKSNCKKFE